MDEYFWYASWDGEVYEIGPESTREAIIAVALDYELGAFENDEDDQGYSFYIVEASKKDIQISEFCDFENILENAEEQYAYSDFSGPEYAYQHLFKVTAEQEKDLVESLKKAAEDWQKRHDLRFISWSFQKTRNKEYVEIKQKLG